MRYVEYMYLAVSIGLLLFLIMSYKEMGLTQQIAFAVGMGVAAFMFSFRRTQRLKLEELEREEEEEWRRLAEEEGAAEEPEEESEPDTADA